MTKKIIKNILHKIDLFKDPILLRSKSKSKISTLSFGVISLIILILFTAMFIDKAIDIINADSSEIKSSSYLQRSSNTTNTTYAQNMMFALNMHIFPFSNLSLTDYFQMKAQIAKKNGSVIQWIPIQMEPCKKEHWYLVIDEDVKKDRLIEQSFYCLPSVISSITAQYDKNFLKISLSKCRNKTTCKSQEEIDQKYSSYIKKNGLVLIYVAYLSSYPDIGEPDGLKYSMEEASFFTPTSLIQYIFLKFDKLNITTDTSYWSLYDTLQERNALILAQTNYAFQEKNSTNNDTLIKFQLSLTNDEIVYQRSITTMDDAFSYVGGLLGIIALVFTFLLKSYNQYRYELQVAQNSFNFNTDGYKFREKDMNFLKYLNYRLHYIVFLVLGKKLRWGDCPEMQETIYEAKKMLDVEGMYRRIEMMEKAVWYRFDLNSLLINTLQKPDTIEQVDKKRKTMDYYQQVINMQKAATVQDAVNKDPKSFSYLDELNRKMSEKRLSLFTHHGKTSLSNLDNQNGKDINQNVDNETDMQIQRSLKQDLNMHMFEEQCERISQYPLISLQAKKMELDEQYDQIEQEITSSFINLSYEDKKKILNKIPIKVLHRLRIRSIKMKEQKKQKEKKQQQLRQSQKNKVNAIVLEDRVYSLQNIQSQGYIETQNRFQSVRAESESF